MYATGELAETLGVEAATEAPAEPEAPATGPAAPMSIENRLG